MKQSVADQTPTPAKIPRQHTDPPFLWVSLGVFSFSLHVLAVQLFYGSPHSHSNSIPPQQSNNPIPIEILEVPSKPTTVTSKPQVDSQKSDGDGINLGYIPKAPLRKRNFRPFVPPKPKPIPRIKPPKIIIQPTPKQPLIPPTPKAFPTPIPTSTFTPTPKPTPRFTPTPIPTSTFTPTPKPTPRFTPTPTQTPTFTPTYPEQPGNVSTGKETPLPDFTPTSIPSPTPPPILPQIFTASSDILTDAEQRQILTIDVIYKLPQLISSVEAISVTESELKSLEFKVILSISNQGNFVSANIPKNQVPAASTNQYVEIVNKIFKNAKFTPGSTKDGITPPESQMVVRIVIQSNSKQP
jgi:hypothetical protein